MQVEREVKHWRKKGEDQKRQSNNDGLGETTDSVEKTITRQEDNETKLETDCLPNSCLLGCEFHDKEGEVETHQVLVD